MARSIGMNIDSPSSVYRGVILYLYSGAHNMDTKVYYTADADYQYHRAEAFGPYGSRAPATGAVTSAIRDTKSGRHWHPANATVSEIVGFVEEQIPGWVTVDGTTRTL